MIYGNVFLPESYNRTNFHEMTRRYIQYYESSMKSYYKRKNPSYLSDAKRDLREIRYYLKQALKHEEISESEFDSLMDDIDRAEYIYQRRYEP